MDWISIARNALEQTSTGPASFEPAAQEAAIATFEADFGVELPHDLREFLLQANGLKDKWGCWVIWSVEEMRARNLEFQTHFEWYMPFEGLLFFSDEPGNGDHYAYAIPRDREPPYRIFRWDHEDDSRVCWASSLSDWFKRAFSVAG
jgi:hypothetical protein